MGSTIAACKKEIMAIITALNEDRRDVRFALVAYRDHHASEAFCTRVYTFTRDAAAALSSIEAQTPGGGGDAPEAVTAGLWEALCLDWRPDAAKQVVVLTDAGPHGLERAGDSLPDGDPDGKDPLIIAREMASLGVSLYTVWASTARGGAALPTGQIVGQPCKPLAFYGVLAQLSGGQCLGLDNAMHLRSLLLGSAADAARNEEHLREARAEVAARLPADAPAALIASETRAALERRCAAKAAPAAAAGAAGASALVVPAAALLPPPPAMLAQALTVGTLGELATLWESPAPASGASVVPEAATASEEADDARMRTDSASRLETMRGARDARTRGAALVECVTGPGPGGRLRVRVISDGYDAAKFVQFPKALRAEGKRFAVQTLVDAGSFYRALGEIGEIGEIAEAA